MLGTTFLNRMVKNQTANSKIKEAFGMKINKSLTRKGIRDDAQSCPVIY
jgi:hypothetical protein